MTLNSGDVHDSTAFDALYTRLKEKFPQMHFVVMDCGYRTPWICKQILDDERVPVLPYKRPMGKKVFFPSYKYVYDTYYDCVLCPENHVLPYATTDRKGYRQFKSNPCHCKNCPSRSKCTESKKCQKVVTKHIWSNYLELVEDIRHTTGMKGLYALRKETIERVFTDAKEKHAMRYTLYRGLSQNKKWVRLKFAAMNPKKFAKHRWNDLHSSLVAFCFPYFSFLNS